MLVYTTLFTLAGKVPKDNKYIPMFYIWFSYLKKYAGLGPGDTVGVIIDDATLDYFNNDDNPYFSYIANDISFELQLSVMPRPATLLAGCAERYNMKHFSNFTKHDICLYTDIDCLSIRNIHPLFKEFDTKQEYLFIMPEVDEGMTHINYAGHFIEACPIAEKMPDFLLDGLLGNGKREQKNSLTMCQRDWWSIRGNPYILSTSRFSITRFTYGHLEK